MKLVIITQFKENYGAHDWDGTDECPQHWKNKGGSVYVADIRKGMDKEVMTAEIRSLINMEDDYQSEVVIDASVYSEGEVFCDEWERPITLSRNFYGEWIASRANSVGTVTSWVMGLRGELTDAHTHSVAA